MRVCLGSCNIAPLSIEEKTRDIPEELLETKEVLRDKALMKQRKP
jgi:hypothetical protein